MHITYSQILSWIKISSMKCLPHNVVECTGEGTDQNSAQSSPERTTSSENSFHSGEGA